MKNFPIIDKETGREYWISRSVAVVIVFIAFDKNGQKCILAVQRGKGTPDPEYVGKYCLPCGYLDFDESGKEAAARELFEETGVERDFNLFELIAINDDPTSDKRQNITFRYRFISNIPVEVVEKEFTTKYSEKDEVSSIRFINVKDLDLYEWAFNHEKIIKKYCP